MPPVQAIIIRRDSLRLTNSRETQNITGCFSLGNFKIVTLFKSAIKFDGDLSENTFSHKLITKVDQTNSVSDETIINWCLRASNYCIDSSSTWCRIFIEDFNMKNNKNSIFEWWWTIGKKVVLLSHDITWKYNIEAFSLNDVGKQCIVSIRYSHFA